MTGRSNGTWDGRKVKGQGQLAAIRRAAELLDIGIMNQEERERFRVLVMTKDGLMLSVFDILRKVPSRVLMILKVSLFLEREQL